MKQSKRVRKKFRANLAPLSAEAAKGKEFELSGMAYSEQNYL